MIPSSPSPYAGRRIALVLGSGGLNPLAAIPLIEFLESRGIRPDLLVGSSGGSLALAMLACGVPTGEMAAAFRRILRPGLFVKDWGSIARMLGMGGRTFHRDVSIFKSRPLMAEIRGVVGDARLEGLALPLVLQATDFDTGEGVELTSGCLADAIYASCAAYPFLHPIALGGRWLFDGCFSAPLPVLPAVRRGMDLVIAMDFSERLRGNPANFLAALEHTHKVLVKSVAQSQALASIDLHGHDVVYVKARFPAYINLWETDAYDRILAAGREAVEEFGEEILAQAKGPSHAQV